MNEIIFMVEEAPEGGFTAHALGAPVFTEAEDLDALYRQVRDSARCRFEAAEHSQVIRLAPKSSERATTH